MTTQKRLRRRLLFAGKERGAARGKNMQALLFFLANDRTIPLLCLAGKSLLAGTHKYLLLTEFAVRTVSYGPSFFPFDLWSKREAHGP